MGKSEAEQAEEQLRIDTSLQRGAVKTRRRSTSFTDSDFTAIKQAQMEKGATFYTDSGGNNLPVSTRPTNSDIVRAGTL